MPQSVSDAHKRYVQQAGWTRAIRQRAFQVFGLPGLGRVLEVGSGTGAILAEANRGSHAMVVGLDCNHEANAFAHAGLPSAAVVTGMGERLPFTSSIFDLVFCHFLLLWLREPLAVLLEMKRVTRPGGAVVCLAEPDYGGRIDYPEGLARLGVMQEESLRSQGADTRIGRRLRYLLHRIGLVDVHAGVLGGEWPDDDAMQTEIDLEWQTAELDLAGWVSTAELDALQAEFDKAGSDRSTVVFVPTFYAWGRKPI